MNRNSNTYTVVYAAVMVVVVAVVLAVASLRLQPRQQANAETEMKGAILRSIGVGLDGDVNALYNKYIVDAFAVDSNGGKVSGADAFGLLRELKNEYEKPAAERVLPVFVSADGRYILPLSGSGLWGPIWGYVALESDWRTISGAVFDHKGETPGLGAEIATAAFGGAFAGKDIRTVSVVKNAGPDGVDAISGGTITSRGVDAMLRSNLEGYLPYMEKYGK